MGDGCSRLATRYDARGDVRRIDYYTAPDQPHPFDNGCSRVRVRHDFRGREIERVCLDEDGRPTTAEAGWERVTVDYEGGGPRESYWNAAAQPVSVQPDTLDGLVALWSADGGSGDGAASWDRGGDRQVRRASDPPRLPAPAPESARPQPQPQPRTEPALRPPPAGQEEAALEVRRLADRLRGEYDDHLDALLDASDRDRAEGEKRIEELLEELEDAAGHLHDAAEEWAEDWEKPNQVTRIRREYTAGKADVGRLAGEVAALAGSHPLGGTASATLAEIRRRASALP
jgi:hypothetical protein